MFQPFFHRRKDLVFLFVLLMGLSTGALANSITIGSIQYLGTSPQGGNAFKVVLNTTGVSASPLTVSNAILSFGGVSQSTGTLLTPTTLLFIIPSTSSGESCDGVVFQLAFDNGKGPVTFSLANGQQITVKAIDWTKMFPLAGQSTLRAGQTIPITLTSVPEPGTLTLVGTGLISLGALFRRRRTGRL